ncbi:MAG TPA: hypothetical protein VNT56_02530 [Acidimicrobiales bacterium]|nr:hypothetical protein [Acidimicrobiales bacterium]
MARRHHRRLHRPGWSAELRAGAELVVHDPDGRVLASTAPLRAPRPPPGLFEQAS